MKKIKLYIATSIDGYIARNDGDIDWLTEYPNPQKTDYGYREFFNSIDTIIMGGRTYRELLCMDYLWSYKDKTIYVITHNALNSKENTHFITNHITEAISQLQEEKGKDIWLMGGGEITTLFLNNDLVDEMIITTMPIILGGGITLFPNNPKESNWKAVELQSFENGVSQTKFIKE